MGSNGLSNPDMAYSPLRGAAERCQFGNSTKRAKARFGGIDSAKCLYCRVFRRVAREKNPQSCRYAPSVTGNGMGIRLVRLHQIRARSRGSLIVEAANQKIGCGMTVALVCGLSWVSRRIFREYGVCPRRTGPAFGHAFTPQRNQARVSRSFASVRRRRRISASRDPRHRKRFDRFRFVFNRSDLYY